LAFAIRVLAVLLERFQGLKEEGRSMIDGRIDDTLVGRRVAPKMPQEGIGPI